MSKPRSTSNKKDRLAFSALSCHYNDQTIYLAVVPAKVLATLAKVVRAEEDPKAGYQRLLDSRRAKDIKEYIEGGSVVPGCIILSAQKEADLQYDDKAREISLQSTPNAFLVIDGQHRLFGAELANGDVPLPVSIFIGLPTEEEVRYFLDINSKQRGVPRTLQLEVMKFLVDPGDPEQTRIRLFNELNSRPESPLFGHMSRTHSMKGKISHVPFANAITPLLLSPPLHGMAFDNQVKLLINYLKAAEKALDDADQTDKMRNAAFFQALMGAFRDTTMIARHRFKNLTEESLANVLEPIERIEWDRHSGTNKKAIGQLTHHILELVSSTDAVDSSML